MVPFFNIPLELFQRILSYLHKEDLSALSCSSKALDRLIGPMLFEHIILDRDDFERFSRDGYSCSLAAFRSWDYNLSFRDPTLWVKKLDVTSGSRFERNMPWQEHHSKNPLSLEYSGRRESSPASTTPDTTRNLASSTFLKTVVPVLKFMRIGQPPPLAWADPNPDTTQSAPHDQTVPPPSKIIPIFPHVQQMRIDADIFYITTNRRWSAQQPRIGSDGFIASFPTLQHLTVVCREKWAPQPMPPLVFARFEEGCARLEASCRTVLRREGTRLRLVDFVDTEDTVLGRHEIRVGEVGDLRRDAGTG